MIGPLAGAVGVSPGPPDFALLHEGAMPQKDQLCGAFWGSLVLSAAGHRGEPGGGRASGRDDPGRRRPRGLAAARRRAQDGLRGDHPRLARRGLRRNVSDGGGQEHRRALRGHAGRRPRCGTVERRDGCLARRDRRRGAGVRPDRQPAHRTPVGIAPTREAPARLPAWPPGRGAAARLGLRTLPDDRGLRGRPGWRPRHRPRHLPAARLEWLPPAAGRGR